MQLHMALIRMVSDTKKWLAIQVQEKYIIFIFNLLGGWLLTERKLSAVKDRLLGLGVQTSRILLFPLLEKKWI